MQYVIRKTNDEGDLQVLAEFHGFKRRVLGRGGRHMELLETGIQRVQKI